MSVYNWVMDHTVGAWRDFLSDTPTLNEYGQALINEQIEKDIARASGVGVGGQTVAATVEVIQQRIEAAKREVNQHLLSEGMHSSQATYEGAADKLRSTAVLIVAALIGSYFVVEFGKAYISRRG